MRWEARSVAFSVAGKTLGKRTDSVDRLCRAPLALARADRRRDDSRVWWRTPRDLCPSAGRLVNSKTSSASLRSARRSEKACRRAPTFGKLIAANGQTQRKSPAPRNCARRASSSRRRPGGFASRAARRRWTRAPAERRLAAAEGRRRKFDDLASGAPSGVTAHRGRRRSTTSRNGRGGRHRRNASSGRDGPGRARTSPDGLTRRIGRLPGGLPASVVARLKSVGPSLAGRRLERGQEPAGGTNDERLFFWPGLPVEAAKKRGS